MARSGLSDTEISIILAWWASIAVIFEIPSGILADKWNRKWLIVLAPILKASCFLLWGLFENTFWIYLLGFFLWGFASTLITGTYQAYIYDYLQEEGRKADYEKVLGRVYSSKRIGTSLGLIIGGLFAGLSLKLPLFASVPPLVTGSVIAMTFKDVQVVKLTEEQKFFKYFGRLIKEVFSSSKLVYLFITTVILGVLGNLEEYDQLYFENVKLPVVLFGFASFIPFFLSGVVESFSYKLKGKKWGFVILPGVSAMLLILSGFFPSQITVATLILAYIAVSPLNVITDGLIQNQIQENRAAVISFGNFLKHIFGIFLYLLFALLLNYASFEAIYLASASAFILYVVYSAIYVRNL